MPATPRRLTGVLAFVESNLTGTGMQAIRLARELGLRTVFLTSDPAKYDAVEDCASTLRTHVDQLLTCDTHDPEAIAKALLDSCGLPAGLMTVMEHYIPVNAEAARLLGLPGLAPEAARIARDKLLTRTVCAEKGVGVPEFRYVRSVEEVDAALELVGLPCVVKLNDESASMGVTLCRTSEEVREQVAEFAARTVDSKGRSRTPGCLIEECLFGHEVSVETFTHGGRTTVLGVTDKLLGPTPYFLELGHTFPSLLPAERSGEAADLALAALEAVGYDFGPAHVEVKLTAQGPRLIEINARTGGDFIPDLVHHATGVRLLEQSVIAFTGGTPDLAPVRHQGAAIRFLAGRDGTVASVTSDGVRRFPTVTDHRITAVPGQRTRFPTNSHERLGHVMTAAPTSAEAAIDAEAALAHLTVGY